MIMLSARAGEEARIEGARRGRRRLSHQAVHRPRTGGARRSAAEDGAAAQRSRRTAGRADPEINQAASLRGKRWNTFRTRSATFDRDYRVTYMNRCGDADCGALGQFRTWASASGSSIPMLMGTTVEDELPARHGGAGSGRIRAVLPYRRHGDLVPVPDLSAARTRASSSICATPPRRGRPSRRCAARSNWRRRAGWPQASRTRSTIRLKPSPTCSFWPRWTTSARRRITKSLLEVADRELQRLSHITARSLKFYRQRTAPAHDVA